MTFRVRREYKNGISVEVEGEKMSEVIRGLASCDSLFFDMTCYAKDESGKWVKDDEVIFTHRQATANGKQIDIFEQRCIGSPDCRRFVRRLGENSDSIHMYAHEKLSDKQKSDSHVVAGGKGWSRYDSDGSSRPTPPPPQPKHEPEPAASSYSDDDDIPF